MKLSWGFDKKEKNCEHAVNKSVRLQREIFKITDILIKVRLSKSQFCDQSEMTKFTKNYFATNRYRNKFSCFFSKKF